MEECEIPTVRERFSILPGGEYRDPDDHALSEGEFKNLLASETGPLFAKKLAGAFGEQAFIWQPGTEFKVPNPHASWIVQPVIEQHPILAEIHPASVNTVRIVTLVNGDDITCELAILRMGMNDRIVDNGLAGGIAAPLDLKTGTLSGPALRVFDVLVGKELFESHPTTGAALTGRLIPFIPESIELVAKGAERLKHEGFRTIGWDVVIGPDGPVVLEGNDAWTVPSVLGVHDVRNSRFGAIAAARPWEAR